MTRCLVPARLADLGYATGWRFVRVVPEQPADRVFRAGWGARMHPPVPLRGRDAVATATQLMADYFAFEIAEHPQDWHMLQPLWRADLPGWQPGCAG